MRSAALVIAMLAVAGIAACGGSSPASSSRRSSSRTPATECAPRNAPAGHVLASGAHLTLHTGALVYVVLVEPEKYASPSYPQAFVWLTPASSNSRVLARAPLCSGASIYTLPLTLTAFRAQRPGRAAIVARLSPPWRSIGVFAAFGARVTVAAG